MKKQIAKLRECRIAKLYFSRPPHIPQFRILAISQLGFLFLLLLLLAFPVVAQTSAIKAPNKVTVTLVRWPYT